MKIKQHEQLRVPAGWSGQEKALIVQLERILTDIYRLLGNLEQAVAALQEEGE